MRRQTTNGEFMHQDVAPVVAAEALLHHGMSDDVVLGYLARTWPLELFECHVALDAAHILFAASGACPRRSVDDRERSRRCDGDHGRGAPDGVRDLVPDRRKRRTSFGVTAKTADRPQVCSCGRWAIANALIGGLLLTSGLRGGNTVVTVLASAGADAADLLGGVANHGRMTPQQQLRGLGGAAVGIAVGVLGARARLDADADAHS